MKLYESNGYANMPAIIESETPFVLCIGGRGTGKTYGALKHLLGKGEQFVYLRRTSAQMELVSKTDFSPIVKVGRDMGMDLVCDSLGKYASAVYRSEDGKPTGQALAYNMALTTISSCRSFDASACTCICYDEAIPETHERAIRNENLSILNMYESIDRNRQLYGKPPVKLVCLCNANNMEAPILDALGCIRILDDMRKKKQNQRVIKDKGLSIYLLNDSPISAEKRQTALYRLSQGQADFNDMALDNAFSSDNYIDVVNKPLGEYLPVAAIGEICLYQHKHDYTWYVSNTRSGHPKEFQNTMTERQRFKLYCIKSWQDYFERRVLFENVAAKVFYKAIMMETM